MATASTDGAAASAAFIRIWVRPRRYTELASLVSCLGKTVIVFVGAARISDWLLPYPVQPLRSATVLLLFIIPRCNLLTSLRLFLSVCLPSSLPCDRLSSVSNRELANDSVNAWLQRLISRQLDFLLPVNSHCLFLFARFRANFAAHQNPGSFDGQTALGFSIPSVCKRRPALSMLQVTNLYSDLIIHLKKAQSCQNTWFTGENVMSQIYQLCDLCRFFSTPLTAF